MPAKDAILEYLGETSLATPQRIAIGLSANDRAKVRMTALQLLVGRNPSGSASVLDQESADVGIDVDSLRRLIGGAREASPDSVSAPGLSELLSGLSDDLNIMLSAVAKTEGDAGGELSKRWEGLRQRLAPVATDQITKADVSAITAVGRGQHDTVHRLVMDLHKRLNHAAAANAMSDVAGAHAIGLLPQDHAPLEAFMKGLASTRGLKFDHPGLETTAARNGDRLVIQNDIGTTDAHVVIITVNQDSIVVTYTDVHRARAKFLVHLLSPVHAEWSGLEERRNEGLADGDDFYLITGRLLSDDADKRRAFLEQIGSALVFLIDWNKARKALVALTDKVSARRILLWAARGHLGHRAWLQLGGTGLIADAVRHAAPSRLGFGHRLEHALGRDGAVEFLQSVLQISVEALNAGGSERLARDQVAAELLRRLERSEAAVLFLAIRQAGLARQIASGIHTHLSELQAGRSTDNAYLAARLKSIETKADRLAVDGRAAAVAAGTPKLVTLIDAVEQAIDELEQAAFISSRLPVDVPPKLLAGLSSLCELAIDSAEALARASDAAIDCPAGRQIDATDALAALTLVSECEHGADDLERDVFGMVLDEDGSAGPLIAVLELSRSLERATDWAARAAEEIRRNLMSDLGA